MRVCVSAISGDSSHVRNPARCTVEELDVVVAIAVKCLLWSLVAVTLLTGCAPAVAPTTPAAPVGVGAKASQLRVAVLIDKTWLASRLLIAGDPSRLVAGDVNSLVNASLTFGD